MYELHIDQQPVMVNGITVNTHTRTSAACLEFLCMISFSRTFLSDCQRRKETLSWRVGFIIIAGHWGQTHTLGLRASISLSLIFQGNSVLCCCAVLSSSCPSFSLKGAIVSSKCLMLMSTKTFCYYYQSTSLSDTFGVNLLFGKGRPFAVRHHNDIVNVQSETLE